MSCYISRVKRVDWTLRKTNCTWYRTIPTSTSRCTTTTTTTRSTESTSISTTRTRRIIAGQLGLLTHAQLLEPRVLKRSKGEGVGNGWLFVRSKLISKTKMVKHRSLKVSKYLRWADWCGKSHTLPHPSYVTAYSYQCQRGTEVSWDGFLLFTLYPILCLSG